MKTWKMASLLLAGITAMALVAGCGSSNNANTGGAADSASSQQAENVTVDFWSAFPDGDYRNDMLREAAADFDSQNPGVEVKIVGNNWYDETAEKLEAAIIAGNEPVLVQIEESFIARFHPVAEDLTKYMDKAVTDNYLDGLLASSYADGVLKAAPMNRSTVAMYVNADMLSAAGLDPAGPKTWDELVSYAAALTDKSKGVYGFSAFWDVDTWYWESALYSYGGEILDADNKVAFNDERGSTIIRLWQQMVKDGTMLNPYGIQDDVESVVQNSFKEGKAAIILASVGSYGGLKKKDTDFQIRAAFQPAGTTNSVATGGGNLIMMKSASEAQKKAAGKFLEYLAGDDFVTKFQEASGYLPITKSSLETEKMKKLFADDPNYKVFVDQVQYAHKRPNHPNWKEMYSAAVESLNLALLEPDRDPVQVTQEIADKVEQVVRENQ